MSRAVAALVVDLQRRLRAAFDEADEAHAAAALIREQRNITLQQLHEANRTIARQRASIASLTEQYRTLHAQMAEWQRAAA